MKKDTWNKLKDAGYHEANDTGLEGLEALMHECKLPKAHGGLYCMDGTWYAWRKGPKIDWKWPGGEPSADGSTAEEAFANLWLTLHEEDVRGINKEYEESL